MKDIRSSWMWDLSIVAMGWGWVVGLSLANCSCTSDRAQVDPPPDAAPQYAPCLRLGQACDLPGDCCAGLLCVGEGICAPVGELVWERDSGTEEPCKVLVDESGSMRMAGYLDRALLAVGGLGLVPETYGRSAIVEPTWDAISQACMVHDRIVVITDEGPQGGSESDAESVCRSKWVRVVGTTVYRTDWPLWVDWRLLTHSPALIAREVGEVCR